MFNNNYYYYYFILKNDTELEKSRLFYRFKDTSRANFGKSRVLSGTDPDKTTFI